MDGKTDKQEEAWVGRGQDGRRCEREEDKTGGGVDGKSKRRDDVRAEKKRKTGREDTASLHILF